MQSQTLPPVSSFLRLIKMRHHRDCEQDSPGDGSQLRNLPQVIGDSENGEDVRGALAALVQVSRRRAGGNVSTLIRMARVTEINGGRSIPPEPPPRRFEGEAGYGCDSRGSSSLHCSLPLNCVSGVVNGIGCAGSMSPYGQRTPRKGHPIRRPKFRYAKNN